MGPRRSLVELERRRDGRKIMPHCSLTRKKRAIVGAFMPLPRDTSAHVCGHFIYIDTRKKGSSTAAHIKPSSAQGSRYVALAPTFYYSPFRQIKTPIFGLVAAAAALLLLRAVAAKGVGKVKLKRPILPAVRKKHIPWSRKQRLDKKKAARGPRCQRSTKRKPLSAFCSPPSERVGDGVM